MGVVLKCPVPDTLDSLPPWCPSLGLHSTNQCVVLKNLLVEIYFIITLTLDHSRLNEGHTMFVERKITKALHNSEALRQFQAIRGLNELKEEIVICINCCDSSIVKFKDFICSILELRILYEKKFFVPCTFIMKL